MTENRTRAQNAAIINAALGSTLDTKANSKPNAPVLQEWADRVGSDPEGVKRDLLAFLVEEELRVELQPSATTEQLAGWLGRLNAGEHDAVLAEVKAAAPAPAPNPSETAQEGQQEGEGAPGPDSVPEGAQDAVPSSEQGLPESGIPLVATPLPPVPVPPAPAAPLLDLLAESGGAAPANPDQGLFEQPGVVAGPAPLPAPVTPAPSPAPATTTPQPEQQSESVPDAVQEPVTVRVTVNGRIARYSGTFTDPDQPRYRVISTRPVDVVRSRAVNEALRNGTLVEAE